MPLAWQEAVLSPITEALREISINGLGGHYFDLKEELRTLVERARTTSTIMKDTEAVQKEALGVSIILSALMINGTKRVPNEGMFIPFLNPEIYNVN